MVQIACLKGAVSGEALEKQLEELKQARDTIFVPVQLDFVRMICGRRSGRIREKTYTEEDGSEKPWLEEEEFQIL